MPRIGKGSPERNARPIRKVNPYDCFRSGEERESIVKEVQIVEKEVVSQAMTVTKHIQQDKQS